MGSEMCIRDRLLRATLLPPSSCLGLFSQRKPSAISLSALVLHSDSAVLHSDSAIRHSDSAVLIWAARSTYREQLCRYKQSKTDI